MCVRHSLVRKKCPHPTKGQFFDDKNNSHEIKNSVLNKRFIEVFIKPRKSSVTVLCTSNEPVHVT